MMINRKFIKVVILMTCVCCSQFLSFGNIYGQDKFVKIKKGFLTGNSYLQLSKKEQMSYVMGLLDGIFLAPFFNAPKVNLEWIENRTADMTISHLTAIITKYLNDNPQLWQESMNVIAYSALHAALQR
jgi:hypothetical protein